MIYSSSVLDKSLCCHKQHFLFVCLFCFLTLYIDNKMVVLTTMVQKNHAIVRSNFEFFLRRNLFFKEFFLDKSLEFGFFLLIPSRRISTSEFWSKKRDCVH